MSYHYPHHVGTIVPAERANARGAAQPAGRHPGRIADGAGILSFARHRNASRTTGNGRPRSKFGAFNDNRKAGLGADWREGAAIAGGLVVLLVTAWLIWAALAEAVLAAAGAA
jgi:hypothetical protein